MRDLSMHVLDIAQNSIKAGAGVVTILLHMEKKEQLTLTVADDGCGMSLEFLAKVTDPFTTTRTTRKIGLGIPMLRQSTELCGGSFAIQSEPGKGTTIMAVFKLMHIDCLPMGEMCDTLFSLVFLNPETPDFVFEAACEKEKASFDTRVVREAVGGLSLNEPDISQWIKASIDEEFKPILEGSK